MTQQAIPIGELSRRTGCNIETIRYYERIGLIPVPLRRGRYRQLRPEDADRLGFVRRARELGFTWTRCGPCSAWPPAAKRLVPKPATLLPHISRTCEPA